jgi:hypothetical protein
MAGILPMHVVVLFEKEEVNIHQKLRIKIALEQTYVDIEYATYFSVPQPMNWFLLITELTSSKM